ncbi:threonine--tRNA ligase [Candidatus Pacearchaeota archaeon]|nr:MAG: threonine--tRNA ligase [Candidatus Pacearchaeota archaeon]
MKILTVHCDYIRFKPLKKAIKSAPDVGKPEEKEVKEPLVVFMAVEQGDDEEVVDKMLSEVEKTFNEVKAERVVLYPYAHLSSELAPPDKAVKLMDYAFSKLSEKFEAERAPFGYYKTFELRCKGHPLSELSKSFRKEGKEESYDTSKLLREISRSKLDTSKLKENDHRILGQKLGLFSFNDAAPGAVFWHNKGYIVFKELVAFLRELLKSHNYEEISTPQIFDNRLWKVSGHWEHYKENMFITSYEKRDFAVKPMNCPAAMLVFKSSTRSYKELPLRFAEFGVVHRKELSGVLAGLFRLIKFTQDDAHIFCTPEQIGSEIEKMMELVKIIYQDTFNISYRAELSTRPEKFIGKREEWDRAEKQLEDVLRKLGVEYKVNEGEGAFYGPKIDIITKDSLGREWQCATIQLDMQMPKRFELEYIDKDNKPRTPVLIHRAILGAVERFIGILLEHTNGQLPFWLSPVQVRVIDFADRNVEAAERVFAQLKERLPWLRADFDFESTTVSEKIRRAEIQRIPFAVTIGDKEEQSSTLAVRERGKKPEFGVKLEEFVKKLEELKAKRK